MLIQINQQHRARYILSERRKHGYQQSYCPEYRMVRRLQLQKDCLLLVYRYLTCYKSIPGFPSGRGVVYVSSKINSFIIRISWNSKLCDPSVRMISNIVGCIKGYYNPIAIKRNIWVCKVCFVDSIRQHVINISAILISRLKRSAKIVSATTFF